MRQHTCVFLHLFYKGSNETNSMQTNLIKNKPFNNKDYVNDILTQN